MRVLSSALSTRFNRALEALIGPDRPSSLGLAVSGGGDSIALMHLSAAWAASHAVALHVITIDHGLRPEARDEIALVKAQCAALGLGHAIRRWQGRESPGNLQANARKARQDLISAWAGEAGVKFILTGHTRDDLVETFLMRLARGSGVDGLAAMEARREINGLIWLRPLLGAGRDELRDYLDDINQSWADDPSNDDPAFERVKFRQAAPALAALGLTPERLGRTAQHLYRARRALECQAADLAGEIAELTAEGVLLLDAENLWQAPEETRLRLVAGAIRFLTHCPYRVRFETLTAALEQLRAGKQVSLGGTLLARHRGQIAIRREPAAFEAMRYAPGCLFDNRWKITGPEGAEATIRPLGEKDLARIAAHRDPDRPAAFCLGTPALWQDDRLVAAPSAGFRANWHVRHIHDLSDFISVLLSH